MDEELNITLDSGSRNAVEKLQLYLYVEVDKAEKGLLRLAPPYCAELHGARFVFASCKSSPTTNIWQTTFSDIFVIGYA